MILDFVKLSPSGNTTVLITNFYQPSDFHLVARKTMSSDYLACEQVGFLLPPKEKGSLLRLEMAGGEFCGDALLATASYVSFAGLSSGSDFCLESSGVNYPLEFYVKEKSSFLFESRGEMPSPLSLEKLELEIDSQKIQGSLVNFEGISHFVFRGPIPLNLYDEIMEALLGKIQAKAWGVIPYEKEGERTYRIRPYVMVQEVGSRVLEKGCGSGSLALALHLKETGLNSLDVFQPGGLIKVELGEKNYIQTDVMVTCWGKVSIPE